MSTDPLREGDVYTGPSCSQQLRHPTPSPPTSCGPSRMRSCRWCRFPRWPTSWPRGSPRPGTGSTWSAAACGTRCSAGRAATWTSPPTPARTPCWRCSPAGRTRSGRPASPSARSVPAAPGTTVEITTFRADAYDRVTRNPVVAFGETIADDLVRRDFTVNAMAVELTGPRALLRRPARRAGRAGRRGAGHPGHAGGVVRRRPAADAAGRPVRLPARADPGPAGAGRR